MKKPDSLLKALKAWVKVNSPAWLAGQMGYKHSETITMWIRRNSIPNHQRATVEKLIGVK